MENKSIITDDSIKELAESIKLLRILEDLKIELHHCDNLTSKSLDMIAEAVPSCKELITFNIMLTGNNESLSNPSLKDLSLSLKNIPKL